MKTTGPEPAPSPGWRVALDIGEFEHLRKAFEAGILTLLNKGMGKLKIARTLSVGVSTVQRVAVKWPVTVLSPPERRS